MEYENISNIEDTITNWYFNNNDEMDRLGLEFMEINKNIKDNTFKFNFKRCGSNWNLKYDSSGYYLSSENPHDSNIIQSFNSSLTKPLQSNLKYIDMLELLLKTFRKHKNNSIGNLIGNECDWGLEMEENVVMNYGGEKIVNIGRERYDKEDVMGKSGEGLKGSEGEIGKE